MAVLSAKMFLLCSFIRSTHLNSEIIILGTSHKHKHISLADTYRPATLCRRGSHPNTTLKRPGGTIKGSQVATHTLSCLGPVASPAHTQITPGCLGVLWRPLSPEQLWHKENHCKDAGEQSMSPGLLFQNKPDVCHHCCWVSGRVPLKRALWISKIGILKSLISNECRLWFNSHSMLWASLGDNRVKDTSCLLYL